MAAKVVFNLCVGCGACASVCPYGAIKVVAKQAIVNEALCQECEECVFACPNGAITI